MSDFFYVTLWQFYLFPVVDISWIIQLSLVRNLFLHTVLSCSFSSGIYSKSFSIYQLFISGKNRSLPVEFRYDPKNLSEWIQSLICLFCYWRHIMQIKSVNNLLGVICCPELTASCVSAASEMELNLGTGHQEHIWCPLAPPSEQKFEILYNLDCVILLKNVRRSLTRKDLKPLFNFITVSNLLGPWENHGFVLQTANVSYNRIYIILLSNKNCMFNMTSRVQYFQNDDGEPHLESVSIWKPRCVLCGITYAGSDQLRSDSTLSTRNK